MKYTIRVRSTNDPLFAPWPIHVASPKGDRPLVVQHPSPFADDNLIGFEREFGSIEVMVLDGGWPDQAVGLTPVFAEKGGMYSARGLIVTSVTADIDQ